MTTTTDKMGALPRAADTVVHAIEVDIRQGHLADGTTLPPERDLVDQFGVSRTVIREAMRILSSRGLVETRPRHRPIVRSPSVDAAFVALEAIVPHLLAQPGGVKNLFNTRILIEAGLVREAATHAGKEDIAALQEALECNKDAIPDSEAFYRTDVDFHRVLYDVTGNPLLSSLHKAYTEWLSPHWSKMPRIQARNQKNYEAHAAVFHWILRRDPDQAERALRSHLEDAWTQVSQTFRGL